MDNQPKKKISSKVWILAAVLTITVVGYVIVSIVENSRWKISSKEEEYQLLADQIYDVMTNYMEKPIIVSQTMACDAFLKELLKEEGGMSEEEVIRRMTGYLSLLKETMDAQTAFVVSEGTHRYYTYEGLNKVIDTKNDEHDIWYAIFINSRKGYDLDVDVDQVNGGAWTVFVNARIEDENGKLLGVCGMGFSMDAFQTILKRMEATYGIKVNFVDPDGLVQVDTNVVNIENAYLYDVQYGKEKDGYAYVNEQGEYVIMRYVESLNWYLVLHDPSARAAQKEIRPFILCGAGLIVINLLVLFMVELKWKEKEEKEA